MSEFVYPPVIGAAKLLFKALDLRITVQGADHIPRTGGAVIACNHVSYLDFIFAGFGAQPAKRLVRFMAKKDVFDTGRGTADARHAPHPGRPQRRAGSYKQALDALRAGEVVGVFPEATISRSFTVKEIKNGAVRMAAGGRRAAIPMALWGTQRLWTKGRPRALHQRHLPVSSRPASR